MQNVTITQTIASPIGYIRFCMINKTLASMTIAPNEASASSTDYPTVSEISDELNNYFKNPLHRFNIPLYLTGTPFQQRVWQALQDIPAGETRTYGELANQLQSSPRAIGQACRNNPIAIIIPCHRVIAANHLGGYYGEQTGEKIKVKKWLLSHEAAQ